VGQAIGSRVGDALRLGDYSLLWASVMAWIGIGAAIVLSALISPKPEPLDDRGQVRPRRD
jgi:hypothetical protein